MNKVSVKAQKKEVERLRLEGVIVEQGNQLAECWKFLQRIKRDTKDDLLLVEIDMFLTGQPFYKERGLA